MMRKFIFVLVTVFIFAQVLNKKMNSDSKINTNNNNLQALESNELKLNKVTDSRVSPSPVNPRKPSNHLKQTKTNSENPFKKLIFSSSQTLDGVYSFVTNVRLKSENNMTSDEKSNFLFTTNKLQAFETESMEISEIKYEPGIFYYVQTNSMGHFGIFSGKVIGILKNETESIALPSGYKLIGNITLRKYVYIEPPSGVHITNILKPLSDLKIFSNLRFEIIGPEEVPQ